MRRFLVAIACLLMLSLNVWSVPASAQDATPAATPDGVASPAADCVAGSEERNAEVARQWYAIWGQQDDSGLQDLVQPDIVHHWGIGDDTSTASDLDARTDAFSTAFPDFRQTVDQVIADGDYVVVRWTATGTQTGPFFNLEPSGVEATWTGINIFRFECGLIAESWNEFDGLGLRDQLEAPSGAATPAA